MVHPDRPTIISFLWGGTNNVVQYRKSKSFGPFRVTVSKRGISTSVGAGPIRISRGADGKVRRTWRIPGTGIYDTKVVGSGRRPAKAPAPARPAAPTWFPLAPNSTMNDRIRQSPTAMRRVRVFVWTCFALTALMVVVAILGSIGGSA